MSEKKLFLLDGHALVYRAHYAFIARPLINSQGINTSAMTGFTRTLWDLIRNQKQTGAAQRVAWQDPRLEGSEQRSSVLVAPATHTRLEKPPKTAEKRRKPPNNLWALHKAPKIPGKRR